MIAAYHDLLSEYPQYKSLINGNISQEEWVWNNVCHPNYGQCPGEFNLALASVSPMTPSSNNELFIIGGGSVGMALVFPNLVPKAWPAEKAEAEKLGARTASPGDPAFDHIVRGNHTIKWAVLEDGTLVVMPKFVDSIEIYHSVLSKNNPVKAAGEAEIASVPGQPVFGVKITRQSGHFMPSVESLKIGVQAFADAGIEFADVDPEIP